MGKPVLRPGVDVTDNPLRRRGAASRPFDGEGVEGLPLAVVEDGVLQNWLLSSSAARELGLETNGHGVRSSASVLPARSNFAIEPGSLAPQELISTIDSGFYVALRYFQQSPEVWLKTGNSPVSEADLAVDAFLKSVLLEARPDYGWISEETDDERERRPFRRYFVVDPIDGTRGFIDGKNEWCISIAVVEDGCPLAGVLECPVLQEHYAARAGGPARLNGKTITVAAPQRREKPLVSVVKSMISRLPVSYLQSVTLESHIPSLAYRLALLSCGRIDAVYIRPDCHDWDIAAADLILQQSGGRLGDLSGQPVRYLVPPFCHGFLLAGGNNNFANMLDIVRKVDLR